MKIVEVAPDDPRLVACQKRYFSEISERFGKAFDPYAGEPDTMERARQWHIVASSENDETKAIGCGTLRDLGNGYAEVKRVWVASSARGIGVAKALMDWLEAAAEAHGFTAIRLDTNNTLVEAQALYVKRGYREIGRYNDNPFADHFFEKIVS